MADTHDVIASLVFLISKIERAEAGYEEILAELKLAVDMLHEAKELY